MKDIIDQPIFLIGSERSGTTLLRLMLDHHPDLAFNLESEYMVTQIADNGRFPEMGEYRDFLASNRVFKHSHFTIDTTLEFRELLNDFLVQKQRRDGKSRVGATVHYQFRKLGFVWPNAKYIYLYRDGRDVANSVVKMGWRGNQYQAADLWLEAENEWAEWKSKIFDDNWIEVKFENLTENPQKELQRICDFLGVLYTEQMFDYVGHSSYKMPNPNMNYQWKKSKSYDIQLIESKIAQNLLSRGYELSGLAVLNVSNYRKAILRADSRLRAYLFKIKRYGILLPLGETLTRKLGLKEINKKMNIAISRINDMYLQ